MLSDVKELSQEASDFMAHRAHEVGKRARVMMGDGQEVCDDQWRRARDLHEALLEEWKDSCERYKYLFEQTVEISGHLETYLKAQGVARLAVDQELWKFRRHAMDGLEGAWGDVLTNIESFRARSWGNVPVALRAIEAIRERISKRTREVQRAYYNIPESDRTRTLKEAMDGDTILVPLQRDLDKLLSLPPGTPPQGSIAPWMLSALSDHNRRHKEIEEAKEKIAFRRQIRAWLLGGQRPIVEELEPEFSTSPPSRGAAEGLRAEREVESRRE